jgi:dipeptidyl aminopeptidase/acylaminoacyl peptidase
MSRRLLLCVVPFFALPLSGQAPQAAKVLTVDDYARWRTISGEQLSSDGRWVAYGTRRTNTLTADGQPMLVLRDLRSDTDVTIADASQPVFSADARWVAYLVEPQARRTTRAAGDSAAPPAAPGAPGAPASTPSAAAGGRGGAATTPPRRWELRELATGTVRAWQDIQSVEFSPTASHLLLRRRSGAGAGAAGAAAGGGGRGAAGGGGTTSADVILHELATGRSILLGSVGETAFNVPGDYLAYTVDAPVRDANGLYLVTLATGAMRALDNDTLRYARVTWDHRGAALAVLKGHAVTGKRERANQLLVFPTAAGSAAPIRLDPRAAAQFPAGFELSERAALDWSEDGQRVFIALIPQQPAADTSRRRSTDSIADVDVWRSNDERIQSQQMVQAEADRNRTFRAVFDVGTARFVALADSSMRDLTFSTAGMYAVGYDPRAYISDWKRSAADVYRVDLATGARSKLLSAQLTGAHVGGISPDGRRFLYWRDARWHAIDLATATSRVLGPGAPSFVNTEYDYTFEKPSYGIAGFTADGSAAIIPTRYDLWLVPLDGGPARNLTTGLGTRERIVLRPVRLAAIDSSARPADRARREWDLSQPMTLSAYGEWTKKSGYYRLSAGVLTPLLFEDASISLSTVADKADRLLFTRQTFHEFPDLRVATTDFANATRISDVNPHQAEYRWGKRILFDYTTRRGVKLQGVLALPDDYVAGTKLPMLVTFYEKNSQTMHRYPTPSFLTGMGGMPVEAVSRGYATMLPDVHFHTGSSHSDMLDAVEAATRKVISMGYVDPKRIGVHGHSYGGEGAAFIGVKSTLFAAVGMGAGVTDLASDFSQSWGWTYQVTGGSGANGNGYYMTGQGRWGFSPWDNPERYRQESALPFAHQAKAPILIMHGTADPTVSFTEGMNFYNALRFNGKDAVMLAYPGEGHGLRGLANRRDLTTRYFQFFDHYLRGTPAPKWMTEGVPYLVKDEVRTPQ